WFEYGDKLLTVVAEENHSNVFTAFIGRGKGEETGDGFSRKIKFDNINWSVENGNPINKPVGQDYVEIKEATKLYGYPDGKPRIAVVDFSDEDDRENLLRLTYEYALENSRPKLQLKATAVDDEKVELGEVCAIIRPNLDIRYKTRIFKVKTDRLSNLQEFEFGDKIVISRSDRIRAEQKIKEKELQEIESRLEQALKNIDIDYRNEDGYNYDLKAGNKYNLPAGYYSFNKPIDENPTKLVYVGAGKVLISNKKGTDGAWIWQTAITGDGISGSEILTHSITANKLASDVGQGLDLSSNEYIQSIVSNNSDISDEVYKKISELNNLLEDKISESTINSLLKEINNQLNVNSTKINQNENRIEIEFESIKAEVDNNRADLNTLTSTITSGQDEDGNSYTEWGSTGDAKVRVGANGIDIISNDQEVMSFRDGEAYAKALYVTETIGFGNHTAQKYGTKYTVFSWNGGK
ncbi:MAG: phage tail spike protein, partial [Tissierellia bacterium]|nr:phage tail spike protein [Tissierellia bacterium]